jgi:hypothetical protein
MSLFAVKEAIASVALSHPEGHDCDTCKAAAGDEDAFARVVLALFEAEERRAGR